MMKKKVGLRTEYHQAPSGKMYQTIGCVLIVEQEKTILKCVNSKLKGEKQ